MIIKINDIKKALVVIPVLFILSLVASADNKQGNIEAGKRVYARCLACHSLARDRTGPRHCGLFGRKAGSIPDFEYSAAMQKASIIWNADTLDRFLKSPLTMLPETTMGFAGIKDNKKRRDLIAYLESVSKTPDICN